MSVLELLSNPIVAVVRAVAHAREAPTIMVGGAVRDFLLGKPVKDFDFAVLGDPIPLARSVASRMRADFYIMDTERRTARVIITSNDTTRLNLDFAACRGTTWEEDLFGRDFSVDAIALDLDNEEILDPTNGRTDLARRVIRQVTAHAIGDDPVRALRAVRLSLTLDASIESATAEAVRASAPYLHQPSPERVRDELMKMLALPAASHAMRQLDALGLLQPVVPEIGPMRTCTQSPPYNIPVLEHTFIALDHLDALIAQVLAGKEEMQNSKAQPFEDLKIAPAHCILLAQQLDSITSNDRLRVALFRLATLLHDAGKPVKRSVDPAGIASFYQHTRAGAELAAVRASALKLSNDEVHQITTTILHHMEPNQLSLAGNPTARAIYRYMHETGNCAPELALFCIADGADKHDEWARRIHIASILIEQYYEHFDARIAPKPLIMGKDLLELGIQQGPQIGQILEAVREAQMVGEIHTREEALQLSLALNRA